MERDGAATKAQMQPRIDADERGSELRICVHLRDLRLVFLRAVVAACDDSGR
jgi:hypothetical protein